MDNNQNNNFSGSSYNNNQYNNNMEQLGKRTEFLERKCRSQYEWRKYGRRDE